MFKFLVMKKIISILILTITFATGSCNSDKKTSGESTTDAATTTGGQETVKDDESQKDIVKIAAGSKDHSTLVAALQKADYVKVLANAGPFTVFAPTNAAFDKLPAGTVDGLMKDDKRADLRNVLEYHVAVGVYKQENMQDGQKINMVNLDDITLSVKDGKLMVNGTANVVATIPASNGIIYVIDAVLLPPAKQ